MALSREGINLGNNYNEQLKRAAQDLSSKSNDLMVSLKGNANFQLFKEGTDKGARIYDELSKCLNAIVDGFVPTIENMIDITSTLLNKQNEDNKSDRPIQRSYENQIN